MTEEQPRDVSAHFEEVLQASTSQHYSLRLFVAGLTPRSSAAVSTLREICEQHLLGRYDLEVIDIYQRPDLANDVKLLAAPTLIKELPRPLRRFIGDLSNRQRILVGLDILPRP